MDRGPFSSGDPEWYLRRQPPKTAMVNVRDHSTGSSPVFRTGDQFNYNLADADSGLPPRARPRAGRWRLGRVARFGHANGLARRLVRSPYGFRASGLWVRAPFHEEKGRRRHELAWASWGAAGHNDSIFGPGKSLSLCPWAVASTARDGRLSLDHLEDGDEERRQIRRAGWPWRHSCSLGVRVSRPRSLLVEPGDELSTAAKAVLFRGVCEDKWTGPGLNA